jgi:hypothetical protein
MSNTPKSARFEQTLLWYDGPQIVLLNAGLAKFVIAVSASKVGDGLMFGALVSAKQLAAYQLERFDLRFLITHPQFRRWFTFRLDDDEGEVKLLPIKKDAPLIREFLPEAGFFARAHEAIEIVANVTPSTTERFDIDGGWDLDEISDFFGNLEDIYHVLHNLDRFADPNVPADEKFTLSENFARPFEGGGSYLGFYRSSSNDNDPGGQLLFSGIKYNSPGYVEIKARAEPFNELLSIVDVYAEDPFVVRDAYKNLYKFLSEQNLLTASPDSYLSDDTRRIISSLSKQLAERLKKVDFKVLSDMASQNVLISAKVLLSLVRRIQKLVIFFEQGRVAHAGIDADALNDI